MRDEEEVKEAFEAQAASANESRELCDIFGLDAGGRHDDRRAALLSLLSGPPTGCAHSSNLARLRYLNEGTGLADSSSAGRLVWRANLHAHDGDATD